MFGEHFNCRKMVTAFYKIATVVHHTFQVVGVESVVRAASNQTLVERIVIFSTRPFRQLAYRLRMELRLWKIGRKIRQKNEPRCLVDVPLESLSKTGIRGYCKKSRRSRNMYDEKLLRCNLPGVIGWVFRRSIFFLGLSDIYSSLDTSSPD